MIATALSPAGPRRLALATLGLLAAPPARSAAAATTSDVLRPGGRRRVEVRGRQRREHGRCRRVEHRLPDQQRRAWRRISQVNPKVNVVVDNHGTGGGFSRYLKGEVDIVDASRPAKPDEEAKAKAQGIDWTRFLVGYDGITVVVNPKNDFVKALTVAQLKALWEPESKVKTWKDLDPSWPDRKIVLYCPDNDSGTFEFFTEAIVGKARSQREDVQASSDDNILVKGVAGDRDGLGYFGYAYYAANKDKLRAVPIKDERRRARRSRRAPRRSSTRPTARCPGRCTST